MSIALFTAFFSAILPSTTLATCVPELSQLSNTLQNVNFQKVLGEFTSLLHEYQESSPESPSHTALRDIIIKKDAELFRMVDQLEISEASRKEIKNYILKKLSELNSVRDASAESQVAIEEEARAEEKARFDTFKFEKPVDLLSPGIGQRGLVFLGPDHHTIYSGSNNLFLYDTLAKPHITSKMFWLPYHREKSEPQPPPEWDAGFRHSYASFYSPSSRIAYIDTGMEYLAIDTDGALKIPGSRIPIWEHPEIFKKIEIKSDTKSFFEVSDDGNVLISYPKKFIELDEPDANGSFVKKIIIYPDIKNKSQPIVFPVDGAFFGVTLSPDGRLIAYSNEKRFSILDTRTGQKIPGFKNTNARTKPAFSDDGKLLVVMDDESRGSLWDVESRTKIHDIEEGMEVRSKSLWRAGKLPPQVAWSHDGKYFLVGFQGDKHLRLYNINFPQPIQRLDRFDVRNSDNVKEEEQSLTFRFSDDDSFIWVNNYPSGQVILKRVSDEN